MLKCLSVLFLTCGTVVFSQTNQAVPASLLLKSQASPFEFAMLLAETAVPSGLELRESDNVRPRLKPDFNIERAQKAQAADLVKAFNSRHSDYRATWMDGVFVIRPTQKTAQYLDEPLVREPIAVTGVTTAANHVFAPLDPTLLTGAFIGSYFGDSADRGDDIPISLDDTGGPRVIDRLNQIVRQAPRTWYVLTREVENKVRIVRFGFIQRGGVSTARNLPASNEQ
jgi:hypothetical protein